MLETGPVVSLAWITLVGTATAIGLPIPVRVCPTNPSQNWTFLSMASATNGSVLKPRMRPPRKVRMVPR